MESLTIGGRPPTIAELEAALAAAKEEREKEWPQDGGPVFWLTSEGAVELRSWNGQKVRRDQLSQGSLFRTEQEAENEAKRREGRAAAQKWVPKKGEFYWYVSRWWLVLPPLTLLAGVLAAVRWTAPRDVKGTETAGHWGYR